MLRDFYSLVHESLIIQSFALFVYSFVINFRKCVNKNHITTIRSMVFILFILFTFCRAKLLHDNKVKHIEERFSNWRNRVKELDVWLSERINKYENMLIKYGSASDLKVVGTGIKVGFNTCCGTFHLIVPSTLILKSSQIFNYTPLLRFI